MSDKNELLRTDISAKQVMFSSFTDKQFMVGTAIGLISIPFIWWWSGSIFALMLLYLLWHGFREWKEKNDLIDARFSEFVKEFWYDRPIMDFIPEKSTLEIDLVEIYSEAKKSTVKTKELNKTQDFPIETPSGDEKPQLKQQPINQQPLEEPTFTEGFDVVEFTIGSNRAMYSIAQLEKSKIPFFINMIPASLYVADGKPYVDIDIYNTLIEPPVRLQHNKIMNRPAYWDMNSDKTALEIINEKQQIVFQLYYKTPSHIVINGLLINGKDTVLASDDGMIINPDKIGTFSIKPIFKYPSLEHRGERC